MNEFLNDASAHERLFSALKVLNKNNRLCTEDNKIGKK